MTTTKQIKRHLYPISMCQWEPETQLLKIPILEMSKYAINNDWGEWCEKHGNYFYVHIMGEKRTVSFYSKDQNHGVNMNIDWLPTIILSDWPELRLRFV